MPVFSLPNAFAVTVQLERQIRPGLDAQVGFTRRRSTRLATLDVPDNSKGLGYVCYSVAGIDGGFSLSPQSVTQEYEGAADLDIPPAQNTEVVTVCRVWSAAKMKIKASLKPGRSNWSGTSQINLELVDPDGKVQATTSYHKSSAQDRSITVRAKKAGFYSFRLRSSALPDNNSSYVLSVSYTAPAKLQ